MVLHRVVYASQPFGFDQAMLNGILADARRCNARDDITGALICRADLYLQWLEGPESAVRGAYARITRDHRHLSVRCLLAGSVDERLFPNWAMLHDPARSWVWSPDEIAAGTMDSASEAEVIGVFARIAAEPA